ncbi:hypothetical protein ACFL1S_03655 [Pseudomonadota bacterium]
MNKLAKPKAQILLGIARKPFRSGWPSAESASIIDVPLLLDTPPAQSDGDVRDR